MCALVGGPFDGWRRPIDDTRQLVTYEFEDETVETDWDGSTVYATRVGLASYRRVGAHTFEHCPTPLAVGDAADITNNYQPLEELP
jgi:hypothetical protein